MRLQIKVVPGASREGIEWLGDLLKIKVRAAPEKGKANAAVQQLLADRLGLPVSRVTIVAGFGSALKAVEIDGMDPESLRSKLGLV